MSGREFIRFGDSFTPRGHERYLLDIMAKEHVAKPRDHMYGSSAAFCPRLNYLYAKMESLDVQTTPESVLYMKIGDGIESALSESLAAKNRLFYSNLRLPKTDPYIGGKIDLVYLDESDKIIIGEVKSCGALPTKPKFVHMQQLLTYLAFGGYTHGKLVYISRNVSNGKRVLIRIFEADSSEASMLRILKKACYTQLAIDNTVLPAILPEFRKSVHCGYCVFKERCWHEDPLQDQFPEHKHISPMQQIELLSQANGKAKALYAERFDRYAVGLHQLLETQQDEKLRQKLIDELASIQSRLTKGIPNVAEQPALS